MSAAWPDQPYVAELGMATAAYLQPPGGWFRNNAGWITGHDQTVLVDTCATETRSRHLLDTVRTHVKHPHAPLTAVITHAHGDHANGAGLVARAGGTLLASPSAAAEIAIGPHTYPTMFHCANWGDITPPVITDTITTSRHLDLGDHVVEIVPVPYTAHTHGDLVVWAPHDGVLFTGDLLFSGVTPLALHGSITGWLDALDWLGQFQARHMVPGHGPLADPRDAIAAVRAYLRWLHDVVDAPGEPDFADLEHQAHTLWPHWLDSERHTVNLRVAHAEHHGRQCDLTTALTAMRATTGGMISLDL